MAQLPAIRLHSVFPPGGQVGTRFKVAIQGEDLDELRSLVFSNPGIQASGSSDSHSFDITIASNVPPGVYEGRISGRFGLSNPRTFVVGDWPEVVESATNHAPADAMEVKLRTLVNGHGDGTSSDFFKFRAAKGERCMVTCWAGHIDSRMSPVLRLINPQGKELHRSRLGQSLDFVPAEDGDYLIELHDTLFQGGTAYFYRLEIGARPRVEFALPASLLPGTKTRVSLFGLGLPGSRHVEGWALGGQPLERIETDVDMPAIPSSNPAAWAALGLPPAAAAMDGIVFRLPSPHGLSTPVFISTAGAPLAPIADTAGSAPAHPSPGQAMIVKAKAPCEWSGVFYPPRQTHILEFEATMGQSFWIDVYSHRLGYAVSPLLVLKKVGKNADGGEILNDVQDSHASDANPGGDELRASTLDPAMRFDVKESGVYRLHMRDLFASPSQPPGRVFRVAIRQASPDFRLAAVSPEFSAVKDNVKPSRVGSLLVRRNGTSPLKVVAFRCDGFDGPIQLEAQGLPAGITADGAIEAGATSGNLWFNARDDAAEWTGAIKVLGHATAGTNRVTRQASGATIEWTANDPRNEVVATRLAGEVTLAVCHAENAPVALSMDTTNALEVATTNKLKIPLRVIRHGEFAANLKFKVSGRSPVGAIKEFDVDGKATNAVVEIDPGALKLAPGEYTFHLESQVAGKYRNNPEGADRLANESKAAEKSAADAADAAKKAATAKAEAAKVLAETEAKAKSAPTATADSSKAATAPDNGIKAANDKLQAATKAETDSVAVAKAAEDNKKSLAAKAKEAAQKANPRDVTVPVYSGPIRFRVVAPTKPPG